VIAEHFYRSGHFDAGEALSEEAHISLSQPFKDQFRELNTIISQLKQHQVDRAMAWAREKAAELDRQGSDLLFNLHKQKYCSLLQKAVI